MKVLDSNGKVFGKINIIDLILIVGAILVLITVSLYAFKDDTVETEWKYIKAYSPKLPEEILNAIEDRTMQNPNQDVEVLDLKYDNELGLLLYLKIKTVKKGKFNVYEGDELTIGNTITFETKNINIKATILNIGNNAGEVMEKYSEKKLTIVLNNNNDWMAESISIGDAELDNNNRVVAKILSKDVEPSKIIVTTDTGDVLVKDHPIDIDIYLDISVLVQDKGDMSFYNDKEIKIGNSIEISTKNSRFIGKIIGIAE